MGKSPDTVRLWRQKNDGQFKLTLCRPIAQALDLRGGETVEWRVRGRDIVEAVFYREYHT